MGESNDSEVRDQTKSWKTIQTQVQALAKKAQQAKTEKAGNPG